MYPDDVCLAMLAVGTLPDAKSHPQPEDLFVGVTQKALYRATETYDTGLGICTELKSSSTPFLVTFHLTHQKGYA